MSAVDFASLLCSRLCHDLLSPVAAVNNGLELLADEHEPELRARCLDLLAESARTSASKLKFFRLAFGSAGAFGETVDTREARAAIEALFATRGKVKVEWLVEPGPLDKRAVKVLLNIALIAGDALTRGGTIDIAAEAAGDQTEIVIRAEGPAVKLDEELRTALEQDLVDESTLTARAAAAWLARQLVIESGGEIQISGRDDPVLLFGAVVRQPKPSA